MTSKPVTEPMKIQRPFSAYTTPDQQTSSPLKAPLASRGHMMRKIKEIKETEKMIVMSKIQTVRDIFKNDESRDVKLQILQNALYFVNQSKSNFGGMTNKNMSSLEKNRIALNLI